MIEYPQYSHLDPEYIDKKLNDFFLEDIPTFDFTSTLTVDKNAISKAVLEAEENIVFAGIGILKRVFANGFQLELHVNDGDKVKAGEKIATITGNSIQILEKERVMLNLIQRLCGIATLTNQYATLAKRFNVKILDTRKTIPGLRLFDKHAVAIGGGYNHRIDLSSGILIKDNHINASGGIQEAISKIRSSEVWQKNPIKIELEVDNLEQLKQGLEVKVDGFLLDNFDRAMTFEAVSIIRSYSDDDYIGQDVFVESSGGINLNNIGYYLDTGINAISIGALTHSAKGANIHLEFYDL